MVETKISSGGAAVYWSLSPWFDRAVLAAGLTNLGLEKLTPSPRPVIQCLRASLNAMYRGQNFLVQKLRDRSALEVVQVRPLTETANEYVQVLLAQIGTDDDDNPKITLSPFEQTLAENLVEGFNNARGLVSGASVSDMLITRVLMLGGTTLREAGGLYWLHNDQLAQWQELTRVVENSSTRDKCACYLLRHNMDEEAVRAVRDAIENESLAESQKLWDEVSSGQLGERALRHRQEKAELLAQKVERFETMLSVSLSGCRSAAENARNAAAAAALMASIEEAPVA